MTINFMYADVEFINPANGLHSIAYEQSNQWIVKLYDEDAGQFVSDGHAFKTKKAAVDYASAIVQD